MQENNSKKYYYVWSELAKPMVCEDSENSEKYSGLEESCEKKYAKYFPGYRFGGFIYIKNGISYGALGISCSASKYNAEVTRTEKGEWVSCDEGHHIKLNGDGTGFAYSSWYSKGYHKLTYEYVDSERFTLSENKGSAYEHGTGTYYTIDGNVMITDKGFVWFYYFGEMEWSGGVLANDEFYVDGYKINKDGTCGKKGYKWHKVGKSWWYGKGKDYVKNYAIIDGKCYMFDSNGYLDTRNYKNGINTVWNRVWGWDAD